MTRMDVREKLIEIVKKAAYSSLPSNTEDFHLNMFVTNLLSHGVTVQEWIPVTERLPEWGERVICTDGYAVFEQYRVGLSCVYGMWDRGGSKSPMQEVTHWMPLPNPPKGE